MKSSSRRSLPIPEEVMEILRLLRRHGLIGYVVGGAVRDLLLGNPVSDWDIATNATPERLVRIFPKVIPTGIRHGTVTVLYRGCQCEVTTFRGGRGHDLQDPPRDLPSSRHIEEDLRHRDFTIDAMAYDPLTGTIVDPFGGEGDLKRGVIRGVDNPLDRFMEDGVRTYRAIRLAATLGYRIEEATLEAIPIAIQKTNIPSWERIRDEILRIMKATTPSHAFEMMRHVGLLAIALPELLEGYGKEYGSGGELYHHLLATADAAPPFPLLRLAGLLHDVGMARIPESRRTGSGAEGHEEIGAAMADAVARRLKLSNRQRRYICQLIRSHELPFHRVSGGSGLRRLLSRIDRSLVDDLFALSIADAKASGLSPSGIRRLRYIRERSKKILESNTPLTLSQLAVRGDGVKEILGIEEGVEVGRILHRLLDFVLEDPDKNNPEDLSSLVKRIAKNRSLLLDTEP